MENFIMCIPLPKDSANCWVIYQRMVRLQSLILTPKLFADGLITGALRMINIERGIRRRLQ